MKQMNLLEVCALQTVGSTKKRFKGEKVTERLTKTLKTHKQID